KTTPKTTPDKILALIRTNSTITRKEIADELDMTIDGIKYHIKKMNTNGILKYVGSTKKGHWEVLK
ncbi:MAG: winged helix-turn-helix transcriptional regulator, partial [Spirochaetales bacterium]|nr:winged helix-turn-helix transcriptional regulator [Spirochaetales bacterium]